MEEEVPETDDLVEDYVWWLPVIGARVSDSIGGSGSCDQESARQRRRRRGTRRRDRGGKVCAGRNAVGGGSWTLWRSSGCRSNREEIVDAALVVNGVENEIASKADPADRRRPSAAGQPEVDDGNTEHVTAAPGKRQTTHSATAPETAATTNPASVA